jgi:hypothetical protein
VKPSIAFVLVVLGGCFSSKLGADKSAVLKMGSQDLACGTDKADVVFYGLRGDDTPTNSPCFGEKAEAVAVVECAGKRKAYWRIGKFWEPRPGEVKSVDANGFELALAEHQNDSGSIELAARCTR